MPIQNCFIFGERCSGTNFLGSFIWETFKLLQVWSPHGKSVGESGWDFQCHKHFFGFANHKIKEREDTLFLAIVRNPYEWLMSLNKKPHHFHHLVNPNKQFYYDELYSVHDKYGEIIHDRNFITNTNPTKAKKFKDIFELRSIKTNFLVNDLPNVAKHYHFIRYEDLISNPQEHINNLTEKFGIRQRKPYPKIFMPKPYEIIDINYINSHIDWNIENKIGYFKREA